MGKEVFSWWMLGRGWVLPERYLLCIRRWFGELSSTAFFVYVASAWLLLSLLTALHEMLFKQKGVFSTKGLEQFICCGWYYKVYILCSSFYDVVLVSNSCVDHPAWHKMAHHRPSPSTKPVPALFLGCCVFVWCETEAGTCSASQIKIPKD